VMSTEDALRSNDVLITATGRPGAISAAHLALLRDGAVLVNAGHYSWEIDIAALRASAAAETVDAGIEVFQMLDGRHVNLLTRGEMLNLAGGGGNPVETMDLGLALQVLSLRRVALAAETLPAGPQPVPADINREVAQGMVELLSRA
jgi:adenosylhomocysteinase